MFDSDHHPIILLSPSTVTTQHVPVLPRWSAAARKDRLSGCLEVCPAQYALLHNMPAQKHNMPAQMHNMPAYCARYCLAQYASISFNYHLTKSSPISALTSSLTLRLLLNFDLVNAVHGGTTHAVIFSELSVNCFGMPDLAVAETTGLQKNASNLRRQICIPQVLGQLMQY